MKCNIGTTEKIIRIIIAVIAVFLGVYISQWFYLITIIALITAAVGYCPVTDVLGINTCKNK